jgi:hypothetical protein
MELESQRLSELRERFDRIKETHRWLEEKSSEAGTRAFQRSCGAILAQRLRVTLQHFPIDERIAGCLCFFVRPCLAPQGRFLRTGSCEARKENQA